jgi:hypothetical protein
MEAAAAAGARRHAQYVVPADNALGHDFYYLPGVRAAGRRDGSLPADLGIAPTVDYDQARGPSAARRAAPRAARRRPP